MALLAFEPWALFHDTTVDEALPQPGASAPADSTPALKELASGEFVTQEHETSGTARILRLNRDAYVVRLEGFSTTNGPDLHVWLSEETAGGNWFKYRTARSIELGALRANNGNQNYAIPADAALDGLTSVVIWCDRFNVAFGTAPVTL